MCQALSWALGTQQGTKQMRTYPPGGDSLGEGGGELLPDSHWEEM